MGVEIERKFLVRTERLPKDLPEGNELEQGYLSVDPTVRVRLVTGPEGTRHAELTIKGKGLLSRAEFNYPIPDEDAETLLGMCPRSLRKVRRKIGRFELDHFRERSHPSACLLLEGSGEREGGAGGSPGTLPPLPPSGGNETVRRPVASGP